MIHPYQSCCCFRHGRKSELSCLGCEMDKLFLEYYGSAVGIDTIAALEEQCTQSDATYTLTRTQTQDKQRGHPIIPSSMLRECWKNEHMRHIAGYSQHDAQEFFNAFIDCLATHAVAYQTSAQDMRKLIYEPQLKQSHLNENSVAKHETGELNNIGEYLSFTAKASHVHLSSS